MVGFTKPAQGGTAVFVHGGCARPGQVEDPLLRQAAGGGDGRLLQGGWGGGEEIPVITGLFMYQLITSLVYSTTNGPFPCDYNKDYI